MQLLLFTASLPWGSGLGYSCNAVPHCLEAVGIANSCITPPQRPGAVGGGSPAQQCFHARGHWAVEFPLLLQCTASLHGGSGQRIPCIALPHNPGVAGNATPAMHCLTAWGQQAV